MGRHVVVGRGAVGNGVAVRLRDRGHAVAQVSRRGEPTPLREGLAATVRWWQERLNR